MALIREIGFYHCTVSNDTDHNNLPDRCKIGIALSRVMYPELSRTGFRIIYVGLIT